MTKRRIGKTVVRIQNSTIVEFNTLQNRCLSLNRTEWL